MNLLISTILLFLLAVVAGAGFMLGMLLMLVLAVLVAVAIGGLITAVATGGVGALWFWKRRAKRSREELLLVPEPAEL